jgi:hypothetical protein
MSASIRRPEDAVNAALMRLGSPLRVNNLYEGTRVSDAALDIYAQTRDELLRQSDWGFAERNVSPTLLKSAPAGGYIPGITTWDPALYPPLDARFEYQYPSDCLKVRAIKPAPLFIPNFDPQPHSFRIANDNTYTPVKKVILCNVAEAVLTYTGQVTDALAWEPDFAEALAAALAKRLAAVLPQPGAAQAEAVDEAATKQTAEAQQG